MADHRKGMNLLATGWLMWVASVGAFTSISTISSPVGQQSRHPLRTPPMEIRPNENLFSSSILTRRSKPSNTNLQHLQLPKQSLIPLFQSSRTETLSTTGSNIASFSPSTTRQKPQQQHQQQPVSSWLPSRPSNSVVYRRVLRRWSKQAILAAEDVQDAWERCSSAALGFVKNFWWLLPLWSLCLVPLYTVTVFQTLPQTPHFWKLVSMEHVLAFWIVPFLASNASYYMAAAHLFCGGASGKQQQEQQSSSDSNKSLALWTLSAGTVSTIFHTVQSLGYYRAAEALCFIDHGVAGTAMLHFWHVCGAPSRRTWALGTAGLACLACPGELYPALHSLWHGLSALTAVVWVRDAAAAETGPQSTK